LSGVAVFSVNNVVGSFSPQEQRKTSIDEYSPNMIKYKLILAFSITILFRGIRRGDFMVPHAECILCSSLRMKAPSFSAKMKVVLLKSILSCPMAASVIPVSKLTNERRSGVRFAIPVLT